MTYRINALESLGQILEKKLVYILEATVKLSLYESWSEIMSALYLSGVWIIWVTFDKKKLGY